VIFWGYGSYMLNSDSRRMNLFTVGENKRNITQSFIPAPVLRSTGIGGKAGI